MSVPPEQSLRPRLVVISDFLPRYDRGTADWYFCDALRCFARHYDVCFLSRRWDQAIHHGSRDKYVRHLQDQGYVVSPLTPARRAAALRAPQTAAVLLWQEHAAFTELLAVRETRPDLPIIYFAQDALYLAWRLYAERENKPEFHQIADRSQRRQRNAIEAADATIFASPDETAMYQQEAPEAHIVSLPVVVETRETDPAKRRPNRLVFTGYMRYGANTDSLIHFLSAIYPRIVAEAPGVVLDVVGGDPPPALVTAAEGRPGVRFLGFVPDVNEILDQARVSVAPLLWGVGIKGKVVEAMAGGLPVVTTEVGAQGMRLQSGEHILIADDPGEFADAVLRLLKDPGLHERIARQGKEYVAEHLSPASMQRRVDALVADLARRSGTRPLSPPLRQRLRRDRRETLAEARAAVFQTTVMYVTEMNARGASLAKMWAMILGAGISRPPAFLRDAWVLRWLAGRTLARMRSALRSKT